MLAACGWAKCLEELVLLHMRPDMDIRAECIVQAEWAEDIQEPPKQGPLAKLISSLTGSGPVGRAAPPAPHTLRPPALLLAALSSALHPASAPGRSSHTEPWQLELVSPGGLAARWLALLLVNASLLGTEQRQAWNMLACLSGLRPFPEPWDRV